MASNTTNSTVPYDAEIIQALSDGQIQLYAFTALSALIVWDCLLCLPREVELLWGRKMGPLAWFYILSRYPFFIYVYASLYIERDLPYCTGISRWAEWMGRVAAISNTGIQIARTYVVCGSKRWILALLLLPMVFGNIFGIVIIAPVTCENNGYGPREKLANFVVAISTIVLQTLLLGFTLRSMSASVREQRGLSAFRNGSVAWLIVQRGVLYYIVIFLITLVELVIFFKGSIYLQSIGNEFAVTISIVLLCRFTLDLRDKVANGTAAGSTGTTPSTLSVDFHLNQHPTVSVSEDARLADRVHAAFVRDFGDFDVEVEAEDRVVVGSEQPSDGGENIKAQGDQRL